MLDNIIGHWKLNEEGTTALDSTTLANHGTITGTSSQIGLFDRSRVFYPNSEDRVEIPDNALFKFESSPFTLTAWFKRSNIPTQTQSILSKWDGTTNNKAWEIVIDNDGTIAFNISSDGTSLTQLAESLVTVTDNDWHLVTVTRSENLTRLYIDGGVIDTNGLTPDIFSSTAPLVIGNHSDSSAWDGSFDGYIDNVRIYNYRLSDEEVNDLYFNTGFDAFAPVIIDISPNAGEEVVSIDTSVVFRYLDQNPNLDTLNVTFNANPVILSGLTQDGYVSWAEQIFDGYSDGYDGYEITIYPDSSFPERSRINVEIDTADAYGTFSAYAYHFWTASNYDPPPSFDNLNPLPGTLGLNPLDPITFQFNDGYNTGVDLVSGATLSSLQVVINGDNVITNGVLQAGYSGSITPNGFFGFDVLFSRDAGWPLARSLNISMDGEDDAGTGKSFSYIVKVGGGPIITEALPPDATAGVIEITPVTFNIYDAIFGIDKADLTVTIGGITAVSNGFGLSGHDVFFTEEQDGYAVLVNHPDWQEFALIDIDISVLNRVSESAALSYFFRVTDYVLPTVQPIVPTNNAQRVDPDTNIEFLILDYGSGIDRFSLDVSVGADTAVTDSLPNSGYSVDIEGAADGYWVVVRRDESFGDLETVTVVVNTDDNEGNNTTHNYTFFTEDTHSPIITHLSPGDGDYASGNSHIAFSAHDSYGVGVALHTVNVTVDGAYAIHNGSFQPGFGGYIELAYIDGYDGYNFRIDPDFYFQYSDTIDIDINLKDAYGNASNANYAFEIYDVSPPIISHLDPEPDSISSLRPYIRFKISEQGGIGVDTSRLNVTVDDLPAILNGYVAPRFSGAVEETTVEGAEGYNVWVRLDSKFDPSMDHYITIDGYDYLDHGVFLEYSFTTTDDVSLPTFENFSPAPGELDVSRFTSVYFEFNDDDAGVDFGARIDTLNVVIEGLQVVSNGQATDGYIFNYDPNAKDGYNVEIIFSAPLDQSEWILVELDGYDEADNFNSYSYSFRTEKIPPFSNFSPILASDRNSTSTNISFDFTEKFNGPDINTLNVVVDGRLVVEDGVATGNHILTTAPIVYGYYVTIDLEYDLPEYTNILVELDGYDNESTYFVDEFWFGTDDESEPRLINHIPSDGSTAVTPYTSLGFDLYDESVVVDTSTLNVWADDVNIIINGTPQQGVYMTTSPIQVDGYNGYSFYITRDERFPLDSDIRVVVDCDDAYGNNMLEDYVFGTYQDLAAPEVVNVNPAPFATGVGLYQDIMFHVIDGYDIDTSRLDVSIDNNPAIIDGVFQPEYNGPSSSLYEIQDGYGIVIDPINKLKYNAQVSVVVDGYDFSNNHIDFVYYFYTIADVVAPVISSRSPDSGEIEVALNSNISFNITDAVSRVDNTRFNVSVDSIPAIINGSFQAGWNGSASAITPIVDGYSVVIDPVDNYELTYNQIRTVTVDGYDLALNHTHEDYWFATISDPNAPIVANLSPAAGSDEAPVNTDIQLDITDAVAGVVGSTINITVDGIPAVTSGVITSVFNDTNASITSIPDGYMVVLDAFVDFGYNETIPVEVGVYDYANNYLLYNYSFVTKVDVNGPTVVAISPVAFTGDHSRSTSVVIQVTDTETLVDLTSLDVTMANQPAMIDGVFATGFDGPYSDITTIDDGYEITIDPVEIFDVDQEVVVIVDGYDFGNNQTHYEYAFAVTDTVGPYLFDIIPEPNSINVENNPVHISFGMRDVGRGFADLTTLSVEAEVGADNGYSVIYDHTNRFSSGWSGYFEIIQSSDGYYFHAFNDDAINLVLYSVRVTVSDNRGNVSVTHIGGEGGTLGTGTGTVSGYDSFEIGSAAISSTGVDSGDILVIKNVGVFEVDGYTSTTISVSTSIPAGGTQEYVLYRGSFITKHTRLFVSEVEAVSENIIEVRLNGEIAEAGNTTAYTITGGDEPLSVVGVVQSSSTIIQLTTDEAMTPLAEYELSIDPDSVVDSSGFAFDDGYTVFPFSGFTDRIGPRVLEAWVGPFNINVTVLFDDYMTQDIYLTNPASYRFSHGAYAISVDVVDADMVVLTVENLFGRVAFDLFVSSNIKDAFGNNLDANYNHAVVTHDGDGTAFSGATGKLKTRNEINRLYEDSRYWYAATSGGLDVISKDTLDNEGFVLDAYGANVVTADDGYIYFASNDGYAADAYHTAVYKIEFSRLDGNSTDNKIEAFAYPVIQSSNVNDLYYGNHAGNGILVIATDQGVTLTIHDRIIQYSSGNNISSAQLSPGGSILYLGNNTLGRVEVYYDIHLDMGNRPEPDAYYSTDTSPELSSGVINQIKVVGGVSIMSPGSNVIYVATSDGLTRIETDESEPGISEAGGLSFTYGVLGSGALFEVLGGQTNNVVAVDVNMNMLQAFVLTSEEFNSGGMTTINIPSNTSFSFRSYEYGTLISRDLRDLTFKNL